MRIVALTLMLGLSAMAQAAQAIEQLMEEQLAAVA